MKIKTNKGETINISDISDVYVHQGNLHIALKDKRYFTTTKFTDNHVDVLNGTTEDGNNLTSLTFTKKD